MRVNAAITSPQVATPKNLGSLGTNAGLLSGSQIIRRGFRLLLFFAAARMLGADSFGHYVLLLTVIEMVAIVSGYGYTDFLTREIAQRPNLAWPLGIKITGLRLALIIPSLGLALVVLSFMRFPSLMVIETAWLGIALVPRALSESVQGIMKGVRRFAPLAWIDFAQGAIALVSAVVLLQSGSGIKGMIAAEVLGCTAAAAVSLFCFVRWVDFHWTAVAEPGSLLRSTFAFNIYPFLTNVYDRIDVVLLSRLAGNFATGIYSLPYRAFATLQIIPYGVMGALLPVLSSDASQIKAAQRCAGMMKSLLLAALVIVLATITFADPAIRLILGPGYSASVRTIEILIWALVPAFLNFALNTLLIAAGKERVFLPSTAVCTVFNILANCLLIPRYSFMGAAVVTVVTEALLLIQNSLYVRRFFGRLVIPGETLKISTVFALIMSASWALSYAMTPVWAGSLGTVFFIVFALINSRGRGRIWAPTTRERTV